MRDLPGAVAAGRNAARLTPEVRGAEAPLATGVAQYERALDVAVKALIVLAAQSALAGTALRRVGDALGASLCDGVVSDDTGRFHAYVDGVDLGAFDTFDGALDQLRQRLAPLVLA